MNFRTADRRLGAAGSEGDRESVQQKYVMIVMALCDNQIFRSHAFISVQKGHTFKIPFHLHWQRATI
jgi:hypothetical protein